MSEHRAAALRLLARTCALPKTMLSLWQALDDAELDALLASRLGWAHSPPISSRVGEIVRNVEAALALPDHPLRSVPMQVLQAHCNATLATYPHDESLRLTIAALLTAASTRQRVTTEVTAQVTTEVKAAAKAEVSERNRVNATGDKFNPDLVEVWVNVLLDPRFSDSNGAGAIKQARAFEAALKRENEARRTRREEALPEVSRQTRAKYKTRARKHITSTQRP